MKKFKILDSLGETIDVIEAPSKEEAKKMANKKYPWDFPSVKPINHES